MQSPYKTFEVKVFDFRSRISFQIEVDWFLPFDLAASIIIANGVNKKWTNSGAFGSWIHPGTKRREDELELTCQEEEIQINYLKYSFSMFNKERRKREIIHSFCIGTWKDGWRSELDQGNMMQTKGSDRKWSNKCCTTPVSQWGINWYYL